MKKLIIIVLVLMSFNKLCIKNYSEHDLVFVKYTNSIQENKIKILTDLNCGHFFMKILEGENKGSICKIELR